MSLRKNIIANYISQLYVTAIGILILPLYIKHMGVEAYGLIGFFTMLQAWFNLLDLGLTPTIGRETARYHGGSISALDYRRLVRILTCIFVVIAVMGGGALFICSSAIADKWLHSESINKKDIILAVKIMSLAIAMRWVGGLYRGVITGSEKLVWLAGFNIIIATLRFCCVFISMNFWGFSIITFFIHQLVVALLEMICLWIMSQRCILDAKRVSDVVDWSLAPIKDILKFSLMIAFTSAVWVTVTQSDKLLLSGILKLSEYGYFSLAVLAASGILIISGPISNALMPRLARLYAEGKKAEVIKIYGESARVVSIIAGSASIVIAFFSEQLLFVWTGDPVISRESASVLSAYAIGNGFLVLSAFPYYLQYAMGNLKYHFIGNIILISTLLPLMFIMAKSFGGIGAGYAWTITNILFFFLWVGFVHSKLLPGIHLRWLYNNFILTYLPVLIFVYAASHFPLFNFSRYYNIIPLFLISSFGVLLAMFFSNSKKLILKSGKYDR